MNRVFLELNSYTQKVRIFLNDQEISQYSELKNYGYKQILEKPEVVLDAIGKELNDDFDLLVTATPYATNKITMAAIKNDYCVSCKSVAAKVNLTTKERAERLAAIIKSINLTVLLTNSPIVPEKTSYGPIELSFTANEDADVDFQINFLTGSVIPPSGKGYVNVAVSDTICINSDFILSICETYLLDPYIGTIVESIPEKSNEITICSRLDPIISVFCPERMEVDAEQEIVLQSYPEGFALPQVTVLSSNKDVIDTYETKLLAKKPGVAEIRIVPEGENTPIHICNIKVDKVVRVRKIEFEGIETVQYEGKTTKFKTIVFPPDAADAEAIFYESSDPNRAVVINNQLILKTPGECTITAKTSHASQSVPITILPKLRKLSLSQTDVSLNVGAWTPIHVTPSPENSYNKDYIWSTSDQSVAVIVKENGQEFIKAVGIGTCTVICKAKEGDDLSVSCNVTVKSALYDEKPNILKKALPFVALIVLAFIFFSRCSSTSKETQNPYEGIDATPVDVFEYVEITFTGYDGKGEVGLEYITADSFVMACNFDTESLYNHSNGDVILIMVSCTRQTAEKYGRYPMHSSKEIVVFGLNELVMSEEQLDNQWFEDAKEYWLNEKNYGFFSSESKVYEYCTSYLLADTDNKKNYFYLVLKCDLYDDNGTFKSTEYCPVIFSDLNYDENGDISNAFASGESDTVFTSIEDVERTFKQYSSYSQIEVKR